MTRPSVPIPDAPNSEYPIIDSTDIISGFGRGSSELGFPTANIPSSESIDKLESGIYFGWCRLFKNKNADPKVMQRKDGSTVKFNNGNSLAQCELGVFPMVMSIGWNPFFHNKERAAEIHIIHQFESDFYGAKIVYAILGYIRPELDYTTKDALIEDIKIDISTALKFLSKDSYSKFKDKL